MPGPFRFVNDNWDDKVASTLDPVGRLVYRSNCLGRDQRITNTGGGNTSASVAASAGGHALARGGMAMSAGSGNAVSGNAAEVQTSVDSGATVHSGSAMSLGNLSHTGLSQMARVRFNW